MLSDDQYTLFLVLGVAAVLIDGQFLYRGGRRYLAGSSGASEADGTMGRMVAVVFHLVSLGVLALLSGVSWGGRGFPAVMAKLGLFLLLTAITHAITLMILSRQRESHAIESRIGQQRAVHGDELMLHPGSNVTVTPAQNAGRPYPETPVDPVPGQPGMPPQVSPDLDQRGPYTI